MSMYQKLCYKVEDLFVNLLLKNKEENVGRAKVKTYRDGRNEK